MINGLILTPMRIIDVTGGSVLRVMNTHEESCVGFGEAYFSTVEYNTIRGWKRHKEMTLNLVVPVGKIKFVLFDDREGSNNHFQEITISRDNYYRLTVPPMVWVGFKGLSKNGSMLLNIANIEHNPFEVDRKNIKEIEFNWNS